MFTRDALSSVVLLGRNRINPDNSIDFFWTGSGITFTTDACELTVDLDAHFDGQEIWLTVEINGALISRQMLTSGRNRVCCFRRMDPGKFRTVRILKETQMDFDASEHFLRFLDIIGTDGAPVTFGPKPEFKGTIEFIGDSITSGEGLNGAVGEMDYVSAYYGFRNNYTRLIADALNLQYSVISQSGWGFSRGWNNNPASVIPRVYESIDGKSSYDFNGGSGADFVTVNLGTNDLVAFHNPAFTDELGNTYKFRLDDDGTFNSEDEQTLINAATDFIKLIASKNPRAQIIIICGMFSNELDSQMSEIYRRVESLGRIHLVKVPPVIETDVGSRMHPGVICNKRCAENVSAKIAELMERSAGCSAET